MGEEEGGGVGGVAEGDVAVCVYDVMVVEDVIGGYEIFEWMWGHWCTNPLIFGVAVQLVVGGRGGWMVDESNESLVGRLMSSPTFTEFVFIVLYFMAQLLGPRARDED